MTDEVQITQDAGNVIITGDDSSQVTITTQETSITIVGGAAPTSFTSLTGSPSDVITAGTNLSWDGDTLNATGSSSPLTTKGDVYTYDTADARLEVGTDGQVLTVDSAEATGLKWATPASGVTDHALLSNLDYASAGHTGFEPTVIKGNLTETTSTILTITGGTGAVIGSGTTIEVDTDLSNYNNTNSGFISDISGESIGDLGDVDLTDIADGKILQYNSGTGNWECKDASGGSGETNTASNVGNGEEVFKQKTGVDFEFKTLQAGDNITIDTGSNELTINAETNLFNKSTDDLEEGLTNKYFTEQRAIDAVDLSGLVPYSGAAADLDLGSYSIFAEAFVTNSGTSSDFVKGDGSLDSATYLTTVAYTDLTGSPSDVITAGTNLSWDGDTLNATGGSGTDLTGLGTDNTIARWDGTDTLQDSGVTIDDNDNVSGVNDIEINQHATFDAEFDNGNSSTADTIDWGVGNYQKSTLTGNCTFTFTAPDGVGKFQLKLVQDATGSRTVTWPGTVKWSGGTAPTLSAGANAIDIIVFYYDGTNYFGGSILDFS